MTLIQIRAHEPDTRQFRNLMGKQATEDTIGTSEDCPSWSAHPGVRLERGRARGDCRLIGAAVDQAAITGISRFGMDSSMTVFNVVAQSL